MRRSGVALVGLLLAALAAAEEKARLVGIVESTSAAQIRVRDAKRGVVSVTLGPGTRYVKGGREAARADVVKGARVVVEAQPAGTGWSAQVVRIGTRRPAYVLQRPGGKTTARTRSPDTDEAGGHADHADHGGHM